MVNHSNSNSTERQNLQETITGMCGSKFEITTSLETIDNYINNYGLDSNKFCSKINSIIQSTGEIKSMSRYVSAVCKNIISNDLELYVEKEKDIVDEIANSIRKSGFYGENWEYMYIGMIENHIYNEFPFEKEDLHDTNRKIAKYLRDRNDNSVSSFTELFLRSKIAKECNIPTDMLKKNALKEAEEWSHLLEQIADTNYEI